MAALKRQSGKDIVVLGSAGLVAALRNRGLVDEFQMVVNPVALGRGKLFFQGLRDPMKLRLLTTKVFRNGNVLLCYQPDKLAQEPPGERGKVVTEKNDA